MADADVASNTYLAFDALPELGDDAVTAFLKELATDGVAAMLAKDPPRGDLCRLFHESCGGWVPLWAVEAAYGLAIDKGVPLIGKAVRDRALALGLKLSLTRKLLFWLKDFVEQRDIRERVKKSVESLAEAVSDRVRALGTEPDFLLTPEQKAKIATLDLLDQVRLVTEACLGRQDDFDAAVGRLGEDLAKTKDLLGSLAIGADAARADLRALLEILIERDPQRRAAQALLDAGRTPWQRGRHASAYALAAKFELVPFTLREDELDGQIWIDRPSLAGPGVMSGGLRPLQEAAAVAPGLLPWLDREIAGDPSFGLRLIYGDGGMGKTRLALELVDRARRLGWTAGFLGPRAVDDATERLFGDLFSASGRILIVVDYAETRPDLVERLVTAADQATARLGGRLAVRILLLARGRDLVEQERPSQAWNALLRGGGVDSFRLKPITLDGRSRRRVYDEAVAAFRDQFGDQIPMRGSDGPDFDDPTIARSYDRVLLIHLAAFAQCFGRKAEHARDALDLVLDHEVDIWCRLAADIGLHRRRDVEHVMHAVALCTLAQGLGRGTLSGLLEASPRFASVDRNSVAALVDGLATLYPDDRGGVAPLQPDIIGEDLVARACLDGHGRLTRAGEALLREALAGDRTAADRIAASSVILRLASRRKETSGLQAHVFEAVRRQVEATLPDIDFLMGVSAELPFEDGAIGIVGEAATKRICDLARTGIVELPETGFGELLLRLGFRQFSLNLHEECLASLADLIGRFGEAQEPALREQVARALFNKGVTLGELGRSEEALAVYDDLLARFGEAQEPALREKVARALFNKGVTLGELGRSEEALAVYDDLVGRFGEAQEPALRERVARALFNKGVTLGQLGRSEDEVAVYDDLVGRFGEAQEPALREQVATALVNKGFTLGQLGRSEDEVAVYDDLVGRFGEAQEPALREQVAMALYNKGVRLGRLGRSEDAVAVYDDLVGRFGEAQEPALREQVAGALFNKGVTLGQLGRSEDAVAVYDDLVARFGEAQEPALREQVAKALVNKGFTLGQLGRPEDEVAVYDDLVGRFGEAQEPALREQVARALYNKGFTLGELGRSEDAVAVYDDLVGRFGEAQEPALREQVAGALFNKGVTLGQLGRSEDAVAVYDDLVARFGEAQEPALREQVAGALYNKGATLGQLGRSEEAVAVYDDLVGRFGEAQEPAVREQVAKALVNKGFTLGELGRSEDEVAVYDDLLARFGEAQEPALREQVAKALVSKGVTLGQLGRPEEAVADYDDLVRRFGEAPEPALRELVARALVYKGFTLGQLGRPEDAVAVYDDLVGRFGEAQEPALREKVAMALVDKGVTLVRLGRSEDAVAVYDDVVGRFGEAQEPALREPVAWAIMQKAHIMLDVWDNAAGAIALYRRAAEFASDRSHALANLAWALLVSGQVKEADALRAGLSDRPEAGRLHLEAAVAFASDNFGEATERLGRASALSPSSGGFVFGVDLFRLLRIAEARGFGEKLIEWFVSSGLAETHAAVYAAFVAYVKGERFLKDFSPEVRAPAKILYERLDLPRRHRRAHNPAPEDRKPRGRSRRR